MDSLDLSLVKSRVPKLLVPKELNIKNKKKSYND